MSASRGTHLRMRLGRYTRRLSRVFRRSPDGILAEIDAALPGLNKTLLIGCRPAFNLEQPGAGELIRLGHARGWAEACGPAKFVSTAGLVKAIRQHDCPAVLMSEVEMDLLSRSDAKKLRDTDLFVWVGIHPSKLEEFKRRVPLHNAAEVMVQRLAYSKIVAAEPKFVWNSIGASGMEWFSAWQNDGFAWRTVFHAADSFDYFPEPVPDKFGHIKMAYVGGYWPEKAQGFDCYLRPWEDILVPYGNSPWPYRNCGGRISLAAERQLYSSAGLIPLVTSPFGWMIGELTERYFKAAACGAFCIADHNPAVRDVFDESEMLQAESAEHFQALVRDYLKGEIDARNWAARGLRAVRDKHLYRHRAGQIMEALESIRGKCHEV